MLVFPFRFTQCQNCQHAPIEKRMHAMYPSLGMSLRCRRFVGLIQPGRHEHSGLVSHICWCKDDGMHDLLGRDDAEFVAHRHFYPVCPCFFQRPVRQASEHLSPIRVSRCSRRWGRRLYIAPHRRPEWICHALLQSDRSGLIQPMRSQIPAMQPPLSDMFVYGIRQARLQQWLFQRLHVGPCASRLRS